MLARRIGDERVLRLASTFIDAGAPGSEPGRGLPIGNLTSQHFANFYLGPLDRLIVRGLGAQGHCRYMDDSLVFADSKVSLWHAHRAIDEFVRRRLDLQLKAEMTRVLPTAAGIPFLGFVVFPGLVRFDPARARRWRRRMRVVRRALDRGAISEEYAERAADSLIGWARHADTRAFRRSWAARRT